MDKSKFFEIVNHYTLRDNLLLDPKFETVEQAYQQSFNKDSPVNFLNECFTLEPVNTLVNLDDFIPSFKKAFAAEDLSLNGAGGFLSVRTQILFYGYANGLIFKENNSLNLSWSRTYGWTFMLVKTGKSIEQPEFMNFKDKKSVIQWAEQHGYFVTSFEEDI